jgi:hypothetical protein
MVIFKIFVAAILYFLRREHERTVTVPLMFFSKVSYFIWSKTGTKKFKLEKRKNRCSFFNKL